MRFPCHWNIILHKWDKKWVLNLHVQQNYSCYKADPTALQSAFFSFLLDKALVMEVRMRKNRPPDQSSARSNLVEEAWLTMACYNGQRRWDQSLSPKFQLCNQILVQSNSSLNTFLFSNKGYIQWTFSLWICLSWCKEHFWTLQQLVECGCTVLLYVETHTVS